MAPTVPEQIADVVGPGQSEQPWIALDDLGLSPATWDVGAHRVQRASPAVVDAEAARLGWLAERAPSPELALQAGEWLVATAIVGTGAHRPERQPVPDQVPAAFGDALRRLHELDVDDCPYTLGWDELVDEIAAAVDGARLDADRLADPYRRYAPGELLALVREHRPVERPEDIVIGHGHPHPANCLLSEGAPAGWFGVARLGRAERHHDLAVAHRGVAELFGPEAVMGFYEGYGRDPDLVRVDHHLLIDALLGAIVAEPLR